MSPRKAWQALAFLTTALYGGIAWLWFVELIPGSGGALPLDARLIGYSVDEARAYLAALTAPARAIYLNDMRVLDTIFPVCLAVFLAAPMIWALRGVWRALALLPIAFLLADLGENAQIAALLRTDEPSDAMIAAASTMTRVKFALLIASAIALTALFMRPKRP
ncbi:hypothetical protein V8J82_10245 [Gymnodinialimonas sp. 2305UL16-5]|uniref:hypothetical protein n=1 Tax=Gymnodinialimonas mytili TaxID=3126503 RepID=UPI0030A58B06